MIARTAQLAVVIVAALTLSCEHSAIQQGKDITGPQAAGQSTSSVVSKVVLTADNPPGNYVGKNACLVFHAKVYDRTDAANGGPIYLPDQAVEWYTVTPPLTFDNTGNSAATDVTRASKQPVSVCGKNDGFGKFYVVADGVSADKSPWSVDVGAPVQTLSVYGPSRMHDNQSSVQLQAQAVDQWDSGTDLTTKAVWSSNDPTVISLSQVAGEEWATQHKIGSATITISVYGKTATLLMKVLGVASVDVQPQNSSLKEGATTQLTATPRDEEGVAFTGKTINWNSLAPGVATVSSSGLVTAVRFGQATITASADGITGSANVTVFADYISGYYVTGLSGAPTPITTSGTYYLNPTTTTTTPMQGPYQYKWDVSYSNGVLSRQVTTFGSGAYPLQAPAGNYTITVTVTPKQYYGTGYPTMWTYPVCTPGASTTMEPLAVWRGTKRPNADGGVIHRVVRGCNQPPA